MNLHRSITNEGHSEQLVDLTLDEIIKAGKVTNHYQTFVLSWLSQYFNEGVRPTVPGLRNPGSIGATSVEVVESIKSLTPEETVKLAQFLKDCLQAGKEMPWGAGPCPVDWMKYVLARQD